MKSNNQISLYGRMIILAASILISIFSLIIWWNDAVSPVDRTNDEAFKFRIEKGDSIREIAQKLVGEKLIKSPTAFFLVIKFQGLDKKVQAGEFRLKKSMNLFQMIEQLNHGVEDVWIRILEGWRNEEIASLLSKELDIPESEFLKVGREGYMFPDTYQISKEATAGAIANLLINTFESKVTSDIRNAIESNGISFYEGVILASLVEREGKSDQDRPMIAGILYNRLKIKMPLQVDATLQYALGYQTAEKSWWKKVLYEEDKKIESPFNTYIYSGFPIAPICNPGLLALKAVAYPKESEYLYYLHSSDGKAYYGRTLEEHNENIRKYL